MRVIYQDDNLLQLRPKGGWVFLLMGALMVVTTPIWLVLLGQTTVLSCERGLSERPTCRLSRSIFSIVTSDRPLEALTGAGVRESTDSDGDTMYQVVLETGGGDVALTRHRSSTYGPKVRQVEEINRFLADPASSSLAVRSEGTVGWIVSGVLALVGAGLVLGGIQASSTVWTFDRPQHIVVKQRGGLLSPRAWHYDLRDIQSATVTSSRDSDGDRTYRVELVTHQGQSIPMTSWYSSGYRGKEQTTQVIRAFLDRA